MTEKKNNSTTVENQPVETPALPAVEQLLALKNEPEKKRAPLDLIDFYPRNRKRFKPGAIEELAANIAIYDVLQDVTLRYIPNDRYELVIGERRVRAARMAGKVDIPAKIYELTDSEAQRIRISENAFREDLHPMEEAYQVAELQQEFPTVDDIARALGKPRTWVFARIRLNGVIEPIQEMFLADLFSLREAFSIALIDPVSQQQFFDQYCSRWNQEKSFRLYDLETKLNQYKYRLKDAPFNPRNKNLVPEAGACTACPHNTAYVNSFFPEQEQSAVCLKKTCFDQKSATQFAIGFSKSFDEFKPETLIFRGTPSPLLLKWIEVVPTAPDLPQLDSHSIQVLTEPAQPDQKQFNKRNPDGGAVPDTDSFTKAMEQHKACLTTYEQEIKGPDAKPALYVTEAGCQAVYYKPASGNSTTCSSHQETAREVEAAIKAGVATPDQVKGLIERSRAREVRNQELDREKIQQKIHAEFSEQMAVGPDGNSLTNADQAAARWLIFSQLPGAARDTVLKRLFPRSKDREHCKPEALFEKFTVIDKADQSFMIRMALLHKPTSKYPKHTEGYFLARVAEAAKLDIKAIHVAQGAIADGRQQRRKDKISRMQQYLRKKSA